MSKTCCFTGHRLHKVPWLSNPAHPISLALHDIVRKRILQKIDLGFDYFISGMALGSDMLCAQIVLELRQSYPEIKLECALPCEEQTKFWSDTQRKDYQEILAKCDYISIMSKRYSPACLHIRNKYMVKKSDCLIAIWNGTSGGTQNTILLAGRHNIPVDIINPDDCATAVID